MHLSRLLLRRPARSARRSRAESSSVRCSAGKGAGGAAAAGCLGRAGALGAARTGAGTGTGAGTC
eukprot:4086149-Pyramimonas_sp.AAC.1